MRTPTLLAELKRLGVVLTAEGDKLKYKAPAGVFTDDLRAAIRAHKPELLRLLTACRAEPPVIQFWPCANPAHVLYWRPAMDDRLICQKCNPCPLPAGFELKGETIRPAWFRSVNGALVEIPAPNGNGHGQH